MNVAPAFGRLLGIPDLRLDTRLASLLAFVYTYHYLNWFIKAEMIHWKTMSRAAARAGRCRERRVDRALFL